MEKERKIENTCGLLAAAFGMGLMLSVLTGCGFTVQAYPIDERREEVRMHPAGWMERIKGSFVSLRSKVGGQND
jgi:hypothetical protein